MSRLVEHARNDDRIYLLTGDLGYSVLEPFREEFPDRFLNVGIAEQNMVAVATGLAREGKKVFTYSIGNFATMRAMEQIRYDVAYHSADVIIVSVGAGYAYGPLGPSHHATEDVAMMRCIPNMIVASPADPLEAASVVDFFIEHSGPGFLRLNKAGERCLHDKQVIDVGPDKLLPILEGSDTVVLSHGAITSLMVDEIQASNSTFALYSCPFASGFTSVTARYLVDSYRQVVTVEEHQKSGGFGSAILEMFADARAAGFIANIPPVRRIAIEDQFVSVSGSQEFLRRRAGLTLSGIL